MTTQRTRYSAECKARGALEALKGHQTVNEFAGTYGVHPTQIAKWKKHLQRELPQIVSTRRDQRKRDQEALQAQLYQQIGQLKVDRDWLKKTSGLLDGCHARHDRAGAASYQSRSAVCAFGGATVDL